MSRFPTLPNDDLGLSRRVPADPVEALRKRMYWDRFYSDPDPKENLPLTTTELASIRRHVLRPGMTTAVDVGSGWGVLTTALAREGLRTTGYDWSPVAVEQARELWSEPQLSFEVHDFLTDNAPRALVPGSVDVLACRLVLPYLDVQRFMTDARRWVRPYTGVVYVVVQVWERQPEGYFRGYPNSVIEGLREGWRHSERWDLDWSGEFTALVLTGPYGTEKRVHPAPTIH
ncbi:class I SAM-dependent methyltransferase [Streptomyces sp. NPDC006656]|uniref:class I SAM-dependent methyltransferase n=1 Tax=Streptomyces sp. NPDC006656 TaxID=3156899 RepID=UPI00345144C7